MSLTGRIRKSTIARWHLFAGFAWLCAAVPAQAQTSRPATEVEVFFATNRVASAKDGRTIFTGSYKDAVTYGKAVAVVKKSGRDANPAPDVIYHSARDVRSTPVSHIKVASIATMEKAEMLSAARQLVNRATRFSGQSLVFVHGYNTSFDAAVRRVAQITHDLKFDGLLFLFSWPSTGRSLDYRVDGGVALKSSGQLIRFLVDDLGPVRTDRLDIVAHSMGNLVLLRALEELQRAGSIGTLNLGEIVMAAPDVDRNMFIEIASSIKTVRLNFTVYTSRHDQALKASECVNQAPRLGQISPDVSPLDAPLVDIIDVTEGSSNQDQWNHSRVFENPYLLHDMGSLLRHRTRPPNLRSPEIAMVVLEPNASRWTGYFRFVQPSLFYGIDNFRAEPTWVDWLRWATRCASGGGK